MHCADGFYYVVKFKNNPQHPRILANDMIATRLGELIGLTVAIPAVVNVDPWLIEKTPALRVERCGNNTAFAPGLSFGSRYVISPAEGQVYDYLPETMMGHVRNVRDFAGVLALDKWTCNADGRQVAFWKKGRERKFHASFIDQGNCFNAGEWSFPDAPLRGVFGRNDVYACVTGWETFEPWLSRIESFPESWMWPLAEEVPPEWYEGRADEMEQLLKTLLERRSRVRDLIESFRKSSRNPFVNWKAEVN